MLQADEASFLIEHMICFERLKVVKKDGYPYYFISVTTTRQCRIVNDVPLPGLTVLVQKWNELGLPLKLNLDTVDQAMQKIEKRIGKVSPLHEREWLDCGSTAIAANSKELSVSRQVKN